MAQQAAQALPHCPPSEPGETRSQSLPLCLGQRCVRGTGWLSSTLRSYAFPRQTTATSHARSRPLQPRLKQGRAPRPDGHQEKPEGASRCDPKPLAWGTSGMRKKVAQEGEEFFLHKCKFIQHVRNARVTFFASHPVDRTVEAVRGRGGTCSRRPSVLLVQRPLVFKRLYAFSVLCLFVTLTTTGGVRCRHHPFFTAFFYNQPRIDAPVPHAPGPAFPMAHRPPCLSPLLSRCCCSIPARGRAGTKRAPPPPHPTPGRGPSCPSPRAPARAALR